MATLAGPCLAILLGLCLTVLPSESTPDLKDERGKASVNNKGILVDVIRQPEKGTERGLEASYIRGKRSKSWGSCKPVCRRRCLPTCNLVCCIAQPYAVPRKVAKKLEKQPDTGYARKKSAIQKHAKKKKTIAKKLTKKKNITAKNKNRGVCKVSCQKACLPSCEFRCCMTPKEKLKEN